MVTAINQIFELSMVLDSEKSHLVFTKTCAHLEVMEKTGDEYTDHFLNSKGMISTC